MSLNLVSAKRLGLIKPTTAQLQDHIRHLQETCPTERDLKSAKMNGKAAVSQDIISGLLLSIDYFKRLFSKL